MKKFGFLAMFLGLSMLVVGCAEEKKPAKADAGKTPAAAGTEKADGAKGTEKAPAH